LTYKSKSGILVITSSQEKNMTLHYLTESLYIKDRGDILEAGAVLETNGVTADGFFAYTYDGDEPLYLDESEQIWFQILSIDEWQRLSGEIDAVQFRCGWLDGYYRCSNIVNSHSSYLLGYQRTLHPLVMDLTKDRSIEELHKVRATRIIGLPKYKEYNLSGLYS
jgi:hypothetical protein